jgi:hypothetical protein
MLNTAKRDGATLRQNCVNANPAFRQVTGTFSGGLPRALFQTRVKTPKNMP